MFSACSAGVSMADAVAVCPAVSGRFVRWWAPVWSCCSHAGVVGEGGIGLGQGGYAGGKGGDIGGEGGVGCKQLLEGAAVGRCGGRKVVQVGVQLMEGRLGVRVSRVEVATACAAPGRCVVEQAVRIWHFRARWAVR